MSKPRVLVADDNPLSLLFFRDALMALGVDCVEARDGTTALEQARLQAFDLLLLDARMPGLDGVEVLAHIRAQQGPSQHAPALATTADNQTATKTLLCAAGFAAVLLKPLGTDSLRAALDQYLPAPAPSERESARAEWIDDAQALAAAGGDRAIASALRGLFIRELDLLPGEFDAIGAAHDAIAMRERLHRLDASAGFCGVPALTRAGSLLRTALDAPRWPVQTIDQFLQTCVRVRAMLADAESAGVVDDRAT